MRIFKRLFCYMFWLVFIYFLFSLNSINAEILENKKWSFDFKNCTISDALRQISKVTGIDLFMNQKNRDKRLFSKTYKEQTIDQILRDIFHQENYAMLWSYNADGLNAIDIWILRGSSSRTIFSREKLSEQRLIKEENDTLKHKTDYKPRAGNTLSDKREVVNSLFRRTKTTIHIKKKSNKSLVFQYSKPSESGSNFENPELSVPAVGISPESAEEEPGGGANELNPPSPSLMPGVSDSETNEPDEGINEEEDQTAETVPPSPAPEEIGGLEPPPMPPGFSYKK